MMHLNTPTKYRTAAKEAVDLFRKISNEKYNYEYITGSSYRRWFPERMFPSIRGGDSVWGDMIEDVSAAVKSLARSVFEISTEEEAKTKILQHLKNANIDPAGLLLTDERPLRYDKILPHFLDAVFYFCEKVF